MVRRSSQSSLTPMIAASVIAGAVGMFFMSMMSSKDTKAIVKQPPPIIKDAPTVQILTTNKPIPIGRKIMRQDLKWRPWPESLLNAEYMTRDEDPKRIDSLVGGIAKLPMTEGEPLVEGKIILPGTRGAMAVLLRKGMRAVSVPISATTSAGGFILPGDYVDILLTMSIIQQNLVTPEIQNNGIRNTVTVRQALLKPYLDLKALADTKRQIQVTEKQNTRNKMIEEAEKYSETEEKANKLMSQIDQEQELLVANSSQLTELFLENVRVLAIDQAVSTESSGSSRGGRRSSRGGGGSDSQTLLGATATLEVTPEQAKLLAWAANTGRLTLSLRSLNDAITTAGGSENMLEQDEQLPKTKTSFALPLERVMKQINAKQEEPEPEEPLPVGAGLELIRNGRISVINNIQSFSPSQSNTNNTGGVNVTR